MRKRVGHVMTVAAAEMDNTEDDSYRSEINDVLLRIEVRAIRRQRAQGGWWGLRHVYHIHKREQQSSKHFVTAVAIATATATCVAVQCYYLPHLLLIRNHHCQTAQYHYCRRLDPAS